MTCKECAYFWKDEDERYPSCHYRSLGPFDPIPCEMAEYDSDEDDGPALVYDEENDFWRYEE
jgi:hypothetical protein